MWTCVICRFEVELDDAVAPTESHHCVCVRCYARETETALATPKELRRELSALLAVVDAVQSV
jgi:hypothetical protein